MIIQIISILVHDINCHVFDFFCFSSYTSMRLINIFYVHISFYRKGETYMITVKLIGYHFHNLPGIDVNRPEGSGDYLFLYLRTPTEVMFNDKYIEVPKNTFIFYEKNKPQVYRHLNDCFINDWIHFDFDDYDSFFEKLEIPFNTPITLSTPKIITDMIADLFIEYFNEGDQHDYIMSSKTETLFHKFSDVYRTTLNSGSSFDKYFDEFSRLRQQIYNYEYVPSCADEIAETLGLSTSYFQHTYKKIFGISVHQDLIKARVEHAARLLQGSSDSVSEIAAQCGYESLEHFS